MLYSQFLIQSFEAFNQIYTQNFREINVDLLEVHKV